jgi:uncharacterized protein
LNRTKIVELTADYVRGELCADTSGHDWWHVERVRKLALAIGEKEGADLYMVELAALLHDISDYKLNGGDKDKGRRIAFDWMLGVGESSECAETVSQIVAGTSFRGASAAASAPSLEGLVVQDADRLDALGAIGIARAFAFGGHSGEPMFDPASDPRLRGAGGGARLNPSGTTIDHFYEKLLLLKDRMHTATARRIAERRHEVLEQFLRQFFEEWDAGDVTRRD